MTGAAVVRPKLVHDFFYVRVADGAYLKSGRGPLHLKGRSVYDWIDRLAPLLDGERSLAELVAGTAGDRRQMIEHLVGVLTENGMVTDTDKQLPHGLGPDELSTYAEEIAFLDSTADSGAHRFERFRQQPVLLAGAGTSIAALVAAALQLGAREVDVSTSADTPSDVDRINDLFAWLKERDPELRLTTVPSMEDCPADVLRQRVEGYGVVIGCSDASSEDRATRFNRAVVGSDTVLLQGVVADGAAWLGPLVRGERGCWECAWRRYAGAGKIDEAPDPLFAGPLCAVAAHTLAFEWFKYATGAGALETDGALVRIDLETADTTRHRFDPHPLCMACAPASESGPDTIRTEVAALSSGPATSATECSGRAARLFDPFVGVVRSVDERSAAQLPLSIAVATVSDPRPGASSTVVAMDDNFAGARLHATIAACETYAGALMTARWCGADGVPRARWGWNVSRDEPMALASGAPVDGPSVSAGFTWHEAVVRGVLTQCHALAADPGYPGDELAPDRAAELSAESARLLSLADALASSAMSCWLARPVPGIVTVTVRLGTVDARGCGLDVDMALRTALRATITRLQGVAPSAPSALIPPPGGLGDVDPALPSLLAQVREAGWEVWAAPAHDDPAVAAALPYLAAVVLVPAR
jgi:putative thiazole-containing bacteriocin maturation protein